MKVVFTIYRWILYPLIIIYLLLSVAPFALGIRPYIVLSASMEPTIMTGALGYINTKDCEDINTGDIVAFTMGDEITVLHRVVGVNQDGTYVTKGDNNDNEDFASLHPSQIVGKVIGSIPKLGYISSWLQTRQGMVIAIGLVVIGLISSWFEDRSDDKKSKTVSQPQIPNYF